MDFDKPVSVAKQEVPNNLYTAILALAFCIVLTTAMLVVVKSVFQYGTLFPVK